VNVELKSFEVKVCNSTRMVEWPAVVVIGTAIIPATSAAAQIVVTMIQKT